MAFHLCTSSSLRECLRVTDVLRGMGMTGVLMGTGVKGMAGVLMSTGVKGVLMGTGVTGVTGMLMGIRATGVTGVLIGAGGDRGAANRQGYYSAQGAQ